MPICNHQTLVKSKLLHLSTVNRTSGSIRNANYTLKAGMLHAQSTEYDTVRVYPMQLQITRD